MTYAHEGGCLELRPASDVKDPCAEEKQAIHEGL
jgi:hypothetical protein